MQAERTSRATTAATGEQGVEENVQVMVRCRPLVGAAEAPDRQLRVLEPNKCVQLCGREFAYDAVFGPEADGELVYMRSARHLVDCAFEGYNCTVFLYGQTGTGKTHTHTSLCSRAFAHLFARIHSSNNRARFLIRASYYELYNEDIRDLLAKPGSSPAKTLELRESQTRGVYVSGLSSYLVNNESELERLKQLGDRQRTTAATQMNQRSSRSHSLLTIVLETSDATAAPATKTSGSNQQPAGGVRVGRLNLIDLAGSERQSKSGSTGSRLKEASRINLSLTCLALVIRALTDKNCAHVPYRNSKLTRLLSSSLGGNSKTLLIACISPALASQDETLNTLRFASRTKRIKNKATINEDAKDALLRNYRRQIDALKRRLRQHQQQQQQQVSEDQAIDSLEGASAITGGSRNDNANNNTEDLLQQLRLLKAKIMVGGENLLEKAELHERLLEASRQELDDKRRAQDQLNAELALKRKIIAQVTQSKGGLQDQVMSLDDKLKRVLVLYKQAKDELKDLSSEHEQLRETLLNTIRATNKELQYADCIIKDFIPSKQLDLINNHAHFDELSDEWQVRYIALSGNNIAQTRRLPSADASRLLRPASNTTASASTISAPEVALAQTVRASSQATSIGLANPTQALRSSAYKRCRDLD